MTTTRPTAIRPFLECPNGQVESLTRALTRRDENHLRAQGFVTVIQMDREQVWPRRHRIHLKIRETLSLDLEEALAVRTFENDFDRIRLPLAVEEPERAADGSAESRHTFTREMREIRGSVSKRFRQRANARM